MCLMFYALVPVVNGCQPSLSIQNRLSILEQQGRCFSLQGNKLLFLLLKIILFLVRHISFSRCLKGSSSL